MLRDQIDPAKDQNDLIQDIPHIQKKRIRGQSFSPRRPVIVITERGPTEVAIENISYERIGWKAYGLASLPSEWVPPFFVITASCFEGNSSDPRINAWAIECIAGLGISEDRQVMIRSSGTSETMSNRGRLKSMPCQPDQVVATIRNLISQVPQIPSSKVHWIVQEHVSAREKGHLSNERQLKKENRDWVVEFEPQVHRPGYTVPIAVRQWRDGTYLTSSDLRCNSEFEITLRLKSVAIWATQLFPRIHFEWVWNGNAVRIVQADVAEPPAGVNPRALLPTQIHSVEPTSLKIFQPATQDDYERYAKLRNVKLYEELGYHMPTFYVVYDTRVIESLLSGQIPSGLEGDLIELTKRPLIIRTDAVSVLGDKREMLPRSEELQSYAEAKEWILGGFKSQVEQSGLGSGGLCLIAHHFIPSVASAWARAEPGNRIVRIESLWGIPEGLYWYSHDTFEVDTLTVDVNFDMLLPSLKYKSLKHLRYKGTFIAPNENGKWIRYQTSPPFDWNKSISKESWLYQIARTTRQVAERERYAVSVMWFIGNHPQATSHTVLPWFHNKSELAGPPKAAPRQKRKSASDFSIKNMGDWQQLQQDLKAGKHIERVVVDPIDPELIRNPQFAEELGGLAASHKFVIDLSGGILSHVYYILQRQGAQVECIDLFGADEDVVDYNKVVRDRVPALIEGRGERVETLRLENDALVAALRQKLVEEAFEALDVKSGEELIGELADVQEVIKALCRALGMNTTDIEEVRKEKEKRRGGFERGLMLIKTATPHSIQQQLTTPDFPTLQLIQQSPRSSISDIADLPAKPLYRRPDLRQVDQELEKMFTFETEANKIGEIKGTLEFSIPMDNQQEGHFVLTVELRRIGSSVRGVVRLRLRRPLQLEIEFPK